MKAHRHAGIAGAALVVVAAAGSLAMLWYPQGLRTPACVAHLAMLAFALAGCTLLAQARGHQRLQRWLPVLLLACLTAPALWLAVGRGTRRCGLGFSHGFVTLVGGRSDLACRLAFGVAALLGMGLVLLAARHAIREDSRLR